VERVARRGTGVVKVDGKRPVKIEGGCPNEMCGPGDW
jgi:hypothetical protein